MGCGGYGRIFDLFEYYGHSRNSCGGHREIYPQPYRYDIDEAMILLKRMYAEGIVNDDEYEVFRQRILNGTMGFNEIKSEKMARLNNDLKNEKRKTDRSKNSGIYKEKINSLKQSKVKVEEIQKKLSDRIEELYMEKEKLESIAEEMLKSSENKAEEYIRRKLDVLENIQSLEKRRDELQEQMLEINNSIKQLETKELEDEAKRLKEELTKMNL